jgi:hypothetical protein
MGLFASRPRVAARQLVDRVVALLHDSQVEWSYNGHWVLRMSKGERLQVNFESGDVWSGTNNPLWLPRWQKWRVRRAARQRALWLALSLLPEPRSASESPAES